MRQSESKRTVVTNAAMRSADGGRHPLSELLRVGKNKTASDGTFPYVRKAKNADGSSMARQEIGKSPGSILHQ